MYNRTIIRVRGFNIACNAGTMERQRFLERVYANMDDAQLQTISNDNTPLLKLGKRPDHTPTSHANSQAGRR